MTFLPVSPSLVILSQTRQTCPDETNIFKHFFNNTGVPDDRNVYLILVHQSNSYSAIRHSTVINNIHIFNVPLLSLSESRNLLSSLAFSLFDNPKYFLFCDDDAYPCDYMKSLEYLMARQNLNFLATGPILNIQNNKPFNRHIIQDNSVTKLALHHYNSFMGSAVFCSAFLFKSILHFDPNLGLGSRFGGSEDADLFVRAIDLDIPVLFHNDLSIMHPKIYKGQYGLSSMYRYGLGRGAFYSKHIHNHFLLFTYRFLFEILANLALAIFSLLCLRINFAQRHLGLLVGKIVGFLTYDL